MDYDTQAFRQFLGHCWLRNTLHFTPDRVREMSVAMPARNYVPVEVRSQVSQAGQIDFIRLQHLPNRTFHREHHSHQVLSFRYWQIGHFLDMVRPDDAAEARIIAVFDQHNPTQCILPQRCSAHIFTQLAHKQFSVVSHQHVGAVSAANPNATPPEISTVAHSDMGVLAFTLFTPTYEADD
jgi:hypothetical protein